MGKSRLSSETIVLFIVLLVGILAPLPACASNGEGDLPGEIVFHERFDGPIGGLPSGWSGDGQIVTEAQAGSGSLKVVDDTSEKYAGANSPVISVQPNQGYTVHVWTKADTVGDDRGTISVLIQEYNEQNTRVATHWLDAQHTSEWTRYGIAFTTHEETVSLRLVAYPAAKSGVAKQGTAWFDELTIVEGILPLEKTDSQISVRQSQDENRRGILWNMPSYLNPDLTLEHPRVFTRDTNFDVPLRTSYGHWMDFSDEEIRELVPKPGSYYVFGLGGVCPIDGSKLEPVGWTSPGKVRCADRLLPDEDYPDDGSGWRAPDGTVYYFTARWNSYVVSQMTGALEPLAYAYASSGDERFAHKAGVILDALATVYPTAIEGPLDYPGLSPGKEGGRLDRPYYQVTRSLRTYVNALDLIWSSGVLDVPSPTNPELTMLENIVYNLILNGADYAYRTVQQPGYRDRLHNGTADFNHGILAAGSLLGIDEYIEWVVNGPTSIGNMIANNIDRDGQYFETSPSYADHTRRLYLDISEILYHLRTPRYPEGINLYNDPRFERFYVGAKEKNSIAGRVALYGDAGPDRAIVRGRRVMDSEAFQWALLFYARTDSPEKKAEYAQYLADLAGGDPNRHLTNGRVHLFKVERITEFDSGAVSSLERPAELFATKGLAFLRSGEGSHERGALMRFGTTLNHGQFDEMGINFYAAGRELSNDPGHSDAHYRAGWTRRTVSHNTVVVDEKSQLTADSPGGSLNYFGRTRGYSVVDASNELTYAETDLYRRTLALIDTSVQDSYLIDIFRVRGGRTRDYSFHALGNTFHTNGLDLSEPEKGSLASPDYCWGNQVRSDGFLIPYANQGYYWSPPPGDSGYGFLCKPRRASGESVWQALWTEHPRSDVGVRLTMLPAANREIIVAEGPARMSFVPYVLARDQGPGPSQFVSIIDLGTGTFQVDRVEPMVVNGPASKEGLEPVGFAATLAEQAEQAEHGESQRIHTRDYVLSTLAGETFTAEHDGAVLSTDAELAVVRVESVTGTGAHSDTGTYSGEGTEANAGEGRVRSSGAAESKTVPFMRMEKGSVLTTPYVEIRGAVPAYHGRVVEVDDETPSLLIEGYVPVGETLKGRHILIDAPEYSHASALTIDRIVEEGDRYRVYVDESTLVLAQGLLELSPSQRVLPSSVDLPYSRNLLGQRNRYFDGKRVTNGHGASTVIERVDTNFAHLHVQDGTGFAQGDQLFIYDVKPGDLVSIPGFVYLHEGDDGMHELVAPEAVWVHLPGASDVTLYHERRVVDGSGERSIGRSSEGVSRASVRNRGMSEFVPAVSEVKDGKQWHRLEPGRVLLQPVARWDQIDGELGEIRVRLVDRGEERPVAGARVYTQFGDRELVLTEVEEGVYTTTLPSGTEAGQYEFVLHAEKDGWAIPDLALAVAISVPWQIEAPAKLEVPLGEPTRFAVNVIGHGADGAEAPGTSDAAVTGTSSDSSGRSDPSGPASPAGTSGPPGRSDPAPDLEVVVVIGDERHVLPRGEDGTYEVTLPPVYRKTAVQILAGDPGGFVRSTEVEVVPTGGKIVPVESEIQVGVRQEFTIEVRLVDVNGNVVPSDMLPTDAYAVVGFASNPVKWVEGTDKAAASLRGMAQGTYRVRFVATGYTAADVTVQVQP